MIEKFVIDTINNVTKTFLLVWSFSAQPVGSFSKPRRLRRGKHHQTKGLMSKTIAVHVHVRFESWYISLPSSATQRREMTKDRQTDRQTPLFSYKAQGSPFRS